MDRWSWSLLRADITALRTSFGAIGWRSGCLPIRLPWTAKPRSSNRLASSNTYSRRKRRIRSVPSSIIRLLSPTERRFLRYLVVDGGRNLDMYRRRCLVGGKVRWTRETLLAASLQRKLFLPKELPE